jgi:hypothetical protein
MLIIFLTKLAISLAAPESCEHPGLPIPSAHVFSLLLPVLLLL